MHFTTYGGKEIYNTIIESLEEYTGEPLYPGDERRIFGEALAALILAMFNKLDDDCRQRLLKYARGKVLDELGARTDTPRLNATKAITTMKFSLSSPRAVNTLIPAGTRVTPDSIRYFVTTEPGVILSNDLTVSVSAKATEGGEDWNGFLPNTITAIVDQIPFVATATNTEESHSGDNGEPYDDTGDDRYRERIRLAPARFSTAGPEDAYKYYALSAHSAVKDVSIISNQEAGTNQIVVSGVGGAALEKDVLDAVQAALTVKKVRPLNDKIIVKNPEVVEFDIEFKYYILANAKEKAIETIEAMQGAIDQYIAWQQEKIGRDINPDKLRSFCLNPSWDTGLIGAIRIDVIKPELVKIDKGAIARWSGIATVNHEITEE